MARLSSDSARILGALVRSLENSGLRVKGLWGRAKSPIQMIADMSQRLDERADRLARAIESKLRAGGEGVLYLGRMLEGCSFKNVLRRGYSIVWSGGEVVSSAKALAALPGATVEMADGKTEVFTGARMPPQESNPPKPATQKPKADERQPGLF